MLFNVGVFLFHSRGVEAGLEFFTGYLTEQSLSIDNIFVFLVLFGYFNDRGGIITHMLGGRQYMRLREG